MWKRGKPPLAPRPLVPSLFHGRCGTELLGQPLPGTAITFTGFGRGRPSSETARLTVPVAAGCLGRRRCCCRRCGDERSPAGREGGRGRTDGRLFTAAPPPDPPSTPAGRGTARSGAPPPRQVWWAPAGREAGVGQARFPRTALAGGGVVRGPPLRVCPKYEALCPRSPAASPARPLPAAGPASGVPGSGSVRTWEPGFPHPPPWAGAVLQRDVPLLSWK